MAWKLGSMSKGKKYIVILVSIILIISVIYFAVSFTLAQIRKDYFVGNDSRTIACSDMDGDGYTDILTSDGDIFFNLGNGDFQKEKRFNGTEYSVACHDFDKDGDNDIVLAKHEENVMSVLFNNGKGYVDFERHYQLDYYADPRWIELGDIDGDGYTDIVIGSDYSSRLVTFINQRNASFRLESTIRGGNDTESFSLVDIDNDDDLDIVQSSSSGWIKYTLPHTIFILENDGSGHFTNKTNFTAGLRTQCVYCADLNADGSQDIITVNIDSNSISLFFNNGNGTSFQRKDYNISHPTVVRCADVDNKNGIDIIVSTYRPYTITVFRNNGKGDFGKRDEYPNHGNVFEPYGLVVCDLNNDDYMDVVTLSSSLGKRLSIFINLGDGTYPGIEVSFSDLLLIMIIPAVTIGALLGFLKGKKDNVFSEEARKINRELFQEAKKQGFIRYVIIFIGIPIAAFFTFFVCTQTQSFNFTFDLAGFGILGSLLFFGVYCLETKFEDFFARGVDTEGKPFGVSEVRKLRKMVLIMAVFLMAVGIFSIINYLEFI